MNNHHSQLMDLFEMKELFQQESTEKYKESLRQLKKDIRSNQFYEDSLEKYTAILKSKNVFEVCEMEELFRDDLFLADLLKKCSDHEFNRIDLSEVPALFRRHFDVVLEFLEQTACGLEDVWLNGNDLDETELHLILEVLEGSSMELFCVADNILSDLALQSMAQFFAVTPHADNLMYLHLSDNNLGSSTIGFKSLLHAFNSTDSWQCQLEELHLRNCSLTTAHMDILSNFMNQNASIKLLKLARNPDISLFGFELLFSSLSFHPSIEELYINSNNLTDAVMENLSCCLYSNSSLLLVDMSFSDFNTGCDIELLAAGLEKNQSLRYLIMYSCDFSNENVLALCEIMKTNRSLYLINLFGIVFENHDIAAFSDALRFNSTLDNFFCNLQNGQQHEYFREALEQNRSLLPPPNYATLEELEFPKSVLDLYDYNLSIEPVRNSISSPLLRISRLILLLSYRLPFEILNHTLQSMLSVDVFIEADAILLQKVLLDRETIGKLLPSLGRLRSDHEEEFSAKSLVRACGWFLDLA